MTWGGGGLGFSSGNENGQVDILGSGEGSRVAKNQHLSLHWALLNS